MKKLVSFIIVLALLLVAPTTCVYAVNDDEFDVVKNQIIYKIYDENGLFLLEKQTVEVGDEFLTKNGEKYEVVQLDGKENIGFAKFVKKVDLPNVKFSYEPSFITKENPTICLYMTHNDESYITGDGTESVYGAGGIHDVANVLKNNLQLLGINTFINETLHIPHDYYAYNRSGVTAKKLIDEFAPDAIFDIHRDGASRGTYVKKVDGRDRCKIRIVVGKSSVNYEIAEQFALYLLSVAEEVCDWLFLDIYYASGHYNQGLYSKALLFEMGSHLVEKNLVLETVPELAKVINTALFNTTVDKDNGNLTINGPQTEQTPVISDALQQQYENTTKPASTATYLIIVLFGGAAVAYVVVRAFVVPRKGKNKKTKK